MTILENLRKPQSVPGGFHHPGIPIAFTRRDKFEAFVSINHSPDLRDANLQRLAENIQQKRAELVRHAANRHLRRKPAAVEAGRHLSLVKFRQRLTRRATDGLTWIFWDRRPIAVMDEPRSRIAGTSSHLYYLAFHFQNLPDPSGN